MLLKSLLNRIKESDKAQELIKTSCWSILGSFLSRGLIFIAWILVGRILGSSDYGAFGLIRETVIMFATFAGLGLGVTASKFIAELLSRDTLRAARILSLTLQFGIITGSLVGLFVFSFASYIADSIINRPEFVIELRIASIILFFSALNGAQIGGLQGLQRFKQIAIINLIQALASFPVFYVGAKYGGVVGSVIALTFYNVIICVLSHIELHKAIRDIKLPIIWREAWKEKKLIVTYSIPAVTSGLIVMVTKWVADIMIINIDNGFYEMGLFTAAYTFNSIFLMMVSMLDAPFLVILSKNQKDAINSNLNRVNIILPWCIGILLILPFLVFPELGCFLFGKTFQGTQFKWTFIIILFFTIILMYKQGLARILAVYNMQWLGLISNVVWGICLIVSFFFLKCYGALGLCISYAIAYVMSTIAILPIYCKRKLIPKNTIFSRYAFYIWGVVIFVTLFNICEVNVICKIVILIISFFISATLFYRYIMICDK